MVPRAARGRAAQLLLLLVAFAASPPPESAVYAQSLLVSPPPPAWRAPAEPNAPGDAEHAYRPVSSGAVLAPVLEAAPAAHAATPALHGLPPVFLESVAAFRPDETDRQGVDGWFYCSRIAGVQEWTPLDLANSRRVGTREAPVIVFSQQGLSGAAVGAYLLHPGMNGNEAIEIAKVWRSNVSGSVFLTGDAVKSMQGGDGVRFEVNVDGRPLVSVSLYQKGENISFTETVDVKVGSEIVFSTNSLASDAFDAIWCRFTLTVTSDGLGAALPPPPPRYAGDCDLLPATPASPAKCAPRLFIVGAMKCGTNTLGKALAEHPAVSLPLMRGEPNYFYPYVGSRCICCVACVLFLTRFPPAAAQTVDRRRLQGLHPRHGLGAQPDVRQEPLVPGQLQGCGAHPPSRPPRGDNGGHL